MDEHCCDWYRVYCVCAWVNKCMRLRYIYNIMQDLSFPLSKEKEVNKNMKLDKDNVYIISVKLELIRYY